LQNAALFAGLVITICGTIVTAAGGPGSAPSLAFALALWGFGLAWAWLGWQRFVEPIWVTVPCGAILALIAPSLAVGEHGWVYAIGIATAAAAMAASVPLRNTPLLALGTLAMFGYVSSVVVQYFHRSLGIPAALAITGVLILGLAVVSARLMRAAHPPKLNKPGADNPSDRDLPKVA
jgi:MFS family permease